ncbi:TPA: DUF4144 family protein, partial [Vibrio parahaemolyticus]|uniref:DUF4144 family protein n=2 Tax=Vibrio parahaemolyticus TaxID=670 RepID=UPI0027E52F6A|nr:DUF4144 family protein [Vibrio parahaemolyticus]
MMIQWPCILKLEGDSELLFLASEQDLVLELEALIWSASDRLIDSGGQSYVVRDSTGSYDYEVDGKRLSLEFVTQLIQEHEFSKAGVCITKIQFSSIPEAIQALALET